MSTAPRQLDPEQWLEAYRKNPIPVTVISGFLGAGKTTMLRHVLQNGEGVRVGVLVNDVAAVNVDAKLVAQRTGGGAAADGQTLEQGGRGGMEMDMVQLQNGCICCSAGDELYGALGELVSLSYVKNVRYDHVLVESSGVAEPRLVRDSFQAAADAGLQVTEMVRLARMVTVVDASTFAEQLNSLNRVRDRPDLNDAPEPDPLAQALGNGVQTNPVEDRQVVDLLVEQVETADVIVLNKLDRVDADQAGLVRKFVEELNGYATIVDAEFGVVPLDAILPPTAPLGEEAPDVDTVAASNEVMDHKAAVDLALSKPRAAAKSTEGGHGHAHEHGPDCTPESGRGDAHDTHDHGHDHDHVADAGQDECGDCGHVHSHDHAHAGQAAGATATTASERFGIGTFVYQRRRPFDRSKLNAVLDELLLVQREQAKASTLPTQGKGASGDAANTAVWEGVLRSKGFVWLAGEPKTAFYWSHARVHGELESLGQWWDAVPRDAWPREYTDSILSDFDDASKAGAGGTGDRRQEIVFIGVNLDERAICDALDSCLAGWDPADRKASSRPAAAD